MNLDSCLNDPSEIYSALKPAWKSYKSKIGKHIATALGEVVDWKESEDLILPIHPYSASIDTTHPDGMWRDRRTLFVQEVKNPHHRVRHGFDESGQVIIAQREHSSTLVLREQRYFDVVGAWHNSDGSFSQMPTRPYYVRYVLDDQRRITAIWSYSPTEDDTLNIETFNWKKDRLVETYLQTFNGGSGLPSWTKDLPPERQATLYRQATKSYREHMPSRSIFRFTYASDGTLSGVEKNQLERPTNVIVVYTRSSTDTVETVLNELIPLLSAQVIATLKKAKKVHPLRAVALLYSAEHIHTGLPYGLAAVPPDCEIEDVTDMESYSVELDWPLLKPALQKVVHRFIIAVESSPKYRDSFAPKAYRELLWQVSLRVAKELQQSKIADKQFTIVPIDDHGDIDTQADFVDCVSKKEASFFPLMRT